MRPNDRWLVAWGVGYAAVGAASLLFPLHALALGGGPALVGVMAATAAFVGVPGALAWARLAARTNRRRPFVLVALGATALVLALAPLADSPLAVVALNAALWFVVAAAAPVLNLVVVEGVPDAEWDGRIALLNAWQGYGWVAGLVLGAVWTAALPRATGYSTADSTQLLFPVLAALAAVGLVLARTWYPERPTTDPDRFRRVFGRLRRQRWGAGRIVLGGLYSPTRLYWAVTTIRPRHPLDGQPAAFGRYLAAVAVFTVGFSVFWGPVPAYLDARFASDAVFGLYVASNVGSAACYAPVGRLTDRLSPLRLQSAALATRVGLFPGVAVAGAGLAVEVALPAFAVGFALIGVTWAVIAVTTTGLVTRLAAPTMRGQALGLQSALVGATGAAGSALGGWLAVAVGYGPTFAWAGALVALGLVLLVVNARAAPRHAERASPVR